MTPAEFANLWRSEVPKVVAQHQRELEEIRRMRMTPIEKLKELEAKATPGEWASRVDGSIATDLEPPFRMEHRNLVAFHHVGTAREDDRNLIVALRNLAPSLMALWEAEQALKTLWDEIKASGQPPHSDFWHQSIYERETEVKKALELLNAKAAQVLHE